MPQLKLTVNDERGIITRMTTLDFNESLPAQQIVSASRLTLNLPRPPKRFFRHGWQSWTLSTWLDPSEPPLSVRSPEFRAKDEDPLYAFSKTHISAWVGAVESDDGQILLIGALALGGRVELDGAALHAFYETEANVEWFIAHGPEDEIFRKYAIMLGERFGKSRYEKAPRVWCSWYSLYKFINEPVILNALENLGDLPFDVFQLDDGWQDQSGNWNAGKNFPSGMAVLADKIKATGRAAGLWLSPWIVSRDLALFRDHPDWLLKDEKGNLVPAGLNWSGQNYALDVAHPAVLDWLDQLIRKVCGWGYEYLKLDFLYAGAAIGKRYKDAPREESYRNALKVMREAAGDAYILACGALILPSLGLCDGLRVGPDVTPIWLNMPLSVWLNNPNHPSTQNAIRTSLHRLWLNPIVNTDPDAIYFRARHNQMTAEQNSLLKDLGIVSRFKATSDLPQWLTQAERESLREFLEADHEIEKIGRYQYRIDNRTTDFSPIIPLPASRNIPIAIAKNLGILEMGRYEVLPAILESRKHTSP